MKKKNKNSAPEIESGYFEKEFYSLFHYQYDIRTVFSDFLTICLCCFSMNPLTSKSYYEDEYLKTIEPYKAGGDVDKFAKLLAALIIEMEERIGSGNDVLGEFFEKHVATDRKAQFFTPWPICQFMAKVNMVERNPEESTEPISVLDPACGSGRLLLAASKELGSGQQYYGIDIDPICVKITAINLFLNGMFNGEVMCADALNPFSFTESYVLSFIPFRITKITEKEQSPLWNRNMSLFTQSKIPEKEANLIQKIHQVNGGSQLKFF